MTESQLARRALLEETRSLLDLAKRRCRASRVSDPELKTLVGSILDAAAQEILHLMETVDERPRRESPEKDIVSEERSGSEDRVRQRRTTRISRKVDDGTETPARRGG